MLSKNESKQKEKENLSLIKFKETNKKKSFPLTAHEEIILLR